MKSLNSITLFGLILGAAVLPVTAEDSVVSVWKAAEGGYHSYRIPSVIRTGKGTLLAFCEGRKAGLSDAGNIDLVMKRSKDDGRSWSEQVVIWDDAANTCGNPCPVLDESTGVVWMLLTHNLGSDHEGDIIHKRSESTRTVWVTSSSDDGVTWETPKNVNDSTKNSSWGWYATGPGVGIQIAYGPHKGRLVIPCDHSYDDPKGNVRKGPYSFGAHVVFSDDHGRTWQLGGVVRPHCNECQVFEVADEKGTLVMNSRSYFGRSRRTQAASSDGGMTWSQPKDVADLVEPVCQASVIRHSWPSDSASGLVLFSNPAEEKRRANLTVKASVDEGKTWSKSKQLHAGPAAYSCLVKLDDSTVGCLFEAGVKGAYESIVFHRLGLSWVH